MYWNADLCAHIFACDCICPLSTLYTHTHVRTHTHSLTHSYENPEDPCAFWYFVPDRSKPLAEKVRDHWQTFTRPYNYKHLLMVFWVNCRWLTALKRNGNLILLKMAHTFHHLFWEILKNKFSLGWVHLVLANLDAAAQNTTLPGFTVLDSISMQLDVLPKLKTWKPKFL